MYSGDIYQRSGSSQDAYACGCRWERVPQYGDVLRLCALHMAHSATVSDEAKRLMHERLSRPCRREFQP